MPRCLRKCIFHRWKSFAAAAADRRKKQQKKLQIFLKCHLRYLNFLKILVFFTYSYSKLIEFYEYEKKCEKNYFKGPKMAAKDDATILFAATILTAPTVDHFCSEAAIIGISTDWTSYTTVIITVINTHRDDCQSFVMITVIHTLWRFRSTRTGHCHARLSRMST